MSTEVIDAICEKLGIAAGQLTENIPKLAGYFIAKDVTEIVAYTVICALIFAVLWKWHKSVKKNCGEYDDIFLENFGFALCFILGATVVCILMILVIFCIRDIILFNVSPDLRVIETLTNMVS